MADSGDRCRPADTTEFRLPSWEGPRDTDYSLISLLAPDSWQAVFRRFPFLGHLAAFDRGKAVELDTRESAQPCIELVLEEVDRKGSGLYRPGE